MEAFIGHLEMTSEVQIQEILVAYKELSASLCQNA